MRSGILGLACLALAIPPANAHVMSLASPLTVAVVAIPQVQVLPLLNRRAALPPESRIVLRDVSTAGARDLGRRPVMTHDELGLAHPKIAADVSCPWFMRLLELSAWRYMIRNDWQAQAAHNVAAAQRDIIPLRREYAD